MENNQTIGAKIALLRKARGLTQADVGAFLSISYQAVSKWERDESCPDFDTLSKLAQFFGVPISYFEKGGAEAATPQTTATTEVSAAVAVPYSAVEEKQRMEKKKQKNAKDRNRGLIWGGVAAGALLAICIFGGWESVLGALLFDLFLFPFVAQMFWDGVVFDIVTRGGAVIGTPGVIFSFDLDGFIFLIAMKILFAVLRFLIYILTLFVLLAVAMLISPFTFAFALIRVNKEGV